MNILKKQAVVYGCIVCVDLCLYTDVWQFKTLVSSIIILNENKPLLTIEIFHGRIDSKQKHNVFCLFKNLNDILPSSDETPFVSFIKLYL